MFKIRTPIASIAISLLALYSANAAAYGSNTWSDSNDDRCSYNCGTSAGNGTEYSYSYDTSSTDKKVTVSAWSSTKYDSNISNKYDRKLEKKEVKYTDKKGYSTDNNDSNDDGSSSYGDRYVDSDKYMDSVLFDYGDKCVVLDSIVIDQDTYGSDSDIKIMAFTGDKTRLKKDMNTDYASFDDYLKDKSYDELMSDGNWKSYSALDVKSDNSRYDSDGDDSYDSYKKNFVGSYRDTDGTYKKDYTASSYWLVMADGKADSNADYFKIKHVGGYDYDGKEGCHKVEIECDKPTPPDGQIPVPATGALLALGLTLLGYTRRRRA